MFACVSMFVRFRRFALIGSCTIFALVAVAQNAEIGLGNVRAGKVIAENVCIACHGADGNSAISMYPSLAGQHRNYLEKQLMDFKSGERKSDVMAPMAMTLSDQDVKNVSAFYSVQVLKRGEALGIADLNRAGMALYRSGDLRRGIPSCMGCHGAAGDGLPPYYPVIKSQHAEYIENQLRDFASGARTNSATMKDVASRLTKEDIKALANYISGLN